MKGQIFTADGKIEKCGTSNCGFFDTNTYPAICRDNTRVATGNNLVVIAPGTGEYTRDTPNQCDANGPYYKFTNIQNGQQAVSLKNTTSGYRWTCSGTKSGACLDGAAGTVTANDYSVSVNVEVCTTVSVNFYPVINTTPNPTPECTAIKIYKGEQIVTDPSTLKPGDVIKFGITGAQAAKARFRVKVGSDQFSNWQVIDTANNANEFVSGDVTIPSGNATFTISVEGEIQGSDGVWR